MLCRYLPVSTPRPNGDHGRMPMPSAWAAGMISRSIPRSRSEYSICAVTRRERPGTASCHVAARLICQPE